MVRLERVLREQPFAALLRRGRWSAGDFEFGREAVRAAMEAIARYEAALCDSMLDALGKLYNVPVHETGVGFKYVGKDDDRKKVRVAKRSGVEIDG